MFANNRTTLAVGAGVAVLACVGAFGWTRRNSDPAPAMNTLAQPAFAQPASGQPAPQQGYNASPASTYQPGQLQEDGYYSSIRRPLYVHNAMEFQPQQPVIEEPQEPQGPPPVVERRAYASHTYRGDDRRRRQHGRSTGKSVAIVAGTAGVGAAIGAVAGGGKGAAIGALSGGGAGFLYDRMTHNHVH
jgi:hypothetical protein